MSEGEGATGGSGTSEPLRVAFHVDQLWFSAPGGIGTYVWELWGALEARDDVHVEPFRTKWNHDPSRVPLTARRPVEVGLPARAAYISWSAFRRPHLPRSLDACGVVHATNPATIPPVRRGQALVVTIHDLAFEDEPDAFPRTWLRLYRRGLDIARREAAVVLVPSEHVAGRVRERGFEPDRVVVTPLAGRPVPVPAPTLGPEAIVGSLGVTGPYILSVGTFEPRKNQARLVRAYRAAVASANLPYTLVLAGHAGWRTEELEAAIAEGGPGRVMKVEDAGDLELDALYRAADAFVYVSLSEGFGMPVLEAMARRTPVVASSTTSVPEVAGDAAILVEPGDEAAIADGLIRVLTDSDLAAALKARGLERSGEFTWARTATDTLAAYRAAHPR
jgi:glycosyltransferase involved in cell wall biosynthesis